MTLAGFFKIKLLSVNSFTQIGRLLVHSIAFPVLAQTEKRNWNACNGAATQTQQFNCQLLEQCGIYSCSLNCAEQCTFCRKIVI
jgi:hypothetical protein